MTETELRESAVLSAVEETPFKGVWRSQLIASDVMGSSGFYPADVLRRDGSRVFPAGTKVYLDHPTEDEEEQRPERSVREMAGYLIEDARYEETDEGRGLFARIQFFDSLKTFIRERAEHVGLSIRAVGEYEDTPQGRIIRSLVNAQSVDVVTQAGAGGRLIYMTESKTGTATGAGKNAAVDNASRDALVDEVLALKESQNNLTLAVTKLVQLLETQRKKNEQALKEALSVGEVVAKLIEAKLPNTSRARLAEAYKPGADLDSMITAEQTYLKEVRKESDVKTTNEGSGTNLGLSESSFQRNASNNDDDDFAAIEELLSGGIS